MFKSQLEPPSENFVETQIFVENIFDTVKKAREAKAARSLAESKLAHYDYSFDFSPSKRKKTRKNAKNKSVKTVGKSKSITPKKKPRKPRTPKDSSEKKKKQQQPTTPKTPRKYTKRAKVKPQNDIDDEEAAFILSSISQRSFDSFYNRLNGNSQIQIPLETVVQPSQPVQPEPSHVAAYHHVLLDHNYWIVEPREPEPEKSSSMNLLLSVAAQELTPKTEVNNNKLPILDETVQPKQAPDNAVKKRWLRQATTECPATVTPPETSPNSDMTKAPLKKRLTAREIDDVSCEPDGSKMDMNGSDCVNNKHKDGIKSVIQSPIGPGQNHNVNVKNNLTFGIQMSSPVDVNAIYGWNQAEKAVKMEQTRNVHGNEIKPLQPQLYDEKLIKLEPEAAHKQDYKSNNVNIVEVKFNEKIPQVYGIKTEVYDTMQHAVKPEFYETKVKLEPSVPDKIMTVDGKLQQILDGKIQRIYRDNNHYFMNNGSSDVHGRINNDQKVQYYSKISEPVSVIQGINVTESPQKVQQFQQQNNHIIIQHTGTTQNDKIINQKGTENFSIYNDHHVTKFPIKPQSSPTKIGQLKGFSSPTKIQISPTRTYEIYTKNPHENVAESLLKLQQESPVKLLQMSPAKVIQSPTTYQIQSETITDGGCQKLTDKKLKKSQKTIKNSKVKPVKVKKTPIKKKTQQKQKKVKAPKSPLKAAKVKKNSVKIDKSLIKNFTNLEDVPLKIRQNLAINEDILNKFKGTDPTVPAISNFNHLIPQFEPQNMICNKLFKDIENQKSLKGSKRTASESSSGSGKAGKRHADAIKSPTKAALKKLKFDDSESERSSADNCEAKIKNLLDGIESSTKNIEILGKPWNQSTVGQKKIHADVNSVVIEDKPQHLLIPQEKSPISPIKLLESPIKSLNKLSPRKLDFDNMPESGPSKNAQVQQVDMSSNKNHQSITKCEQNKACDMKYVEITAQPSILTGINPNMTCKFPDLSRLSSKVDEYSDSDTDTAESEGSDCEGQNKPTVKFSGEGTSKLVSNSIASSSKGLFGPNKLQNNSISVINKIVNSTIINSVAEVNISAVCEKLDAAKVDSVEQKMTTELDEKSTVPNDKPYKICKAINIPDVEKSTTEKVPILESCEEPTKTVNLEAKKSAKLNNSEELEKNTADPVIVKPEPLKSMEVAVEVISTAEKPVKSENLVEMTLETVKEPTTSATESDLVPKTVDVEEVTQKSTKEPEKLDLEPATTSEPATPSILNPDPVSTIKSITKPGLDILKSTIDLESIKSIVGSTITTTSTLESPLKPVVEQQVASILEKVIPKTLKTDFVKELDIEVDKPENEAVFAVSAEKDEDSDDEDVTVYREAVEEFHKDTLEKLMTANKRFCRDGFVHNPFKHSLSYDGCKDTRNYGTARGSRSYDYDDHRKPLKMSLSFDSHQQQPYHHYQRSTSEVFHDPRKERWSGNGIYENRSYGSFHYDKIHHREPITTTYSMYRAQKASQIDTRWNSQSRPPYDYPQESSIKVNNFEPEKKQTVTPLPPQQPQPAVINTYRPAQPELTRAEPIPVRAVSPQAEALKNATSDGFGGFFKEILAVSPAALPKTKTSSSDPRLNPSLVQDVKKEEPATPKKKLSLDQYRKRKSLTNVTQSSPSDDIVPSISVSISESPSPTLPPAFDPTIAAAAATG